MDLSLIVLALCAASVTGQGGSNVHGGQSDIRDNQRCCTHDLWHGTIQMSRGILPPGASVPTITWETNHVDYDYIKRWETTNKTVTNMATGEITNTIIWADFSRGLMYTYAVKDGSCSSAPLPAGHTMRAPCIDSDFTYQGRMNIGSGSEMIHGHGWAGPMNGLQLLVIYSESDCTPISETAVGDVNGTQVLLSGLWMDVKQGAVRSANVFSVPSGCRSLEGLSPVG